MAQERDSNFEAAEERAEARANELIGEFHEHYQDYVRLHPEHEDRKRDIFEAWAIQKIAGLQLCIEHIAQQVNVHLRGTDSPF